MLAVYIMSIWPAMIDRVTSRGATSGVAAGALFALATVTYVAETLFSVWTVAYNFVPGGVYTREHSGYLIAFAMLTIAAAFFVGTF